MGLSLLVSACGGSPRSPVAQLGTTATQTSTSSPNGSAASTQQNGALAWAQCMRSSGVPNLSDPTSNKIKIPSAQQLGVGSSQLQTAENACRHLLPASANELPTGAQMQQSLSGMRRFAQCMRTHGLANWPDPTIGSQGRPSFKLVGIPGLDSSSPQTQNAVRECGHLVPKSLGGIPISSP